MDQSNKQPDAIFYVLAFALIVLFALDFFLGPYILKGFLFVQRGFVNAALYLTHSAKYAAIHTTIDAYTPAEWTWPKLNALAASTRLIAFPALASILALYGWRVTRSNPAGRLRRNFDMKSFASSEVSQWGWIAPVKDKDLVHAPLDSGPYAMGMTELQLVHHYRLLESHEHLTINELRTEKLFSSQLGRLWEGHARLRTHERALYACFIAQLCRDRKQSLAALEALSRSAATGKLDTSITDGLLRKHRHDPRVTKEVARHAYVSTVLCGVMLAAQRFGKIPPGFFIWLRPLDRALWYALHSAGRRTPFTEAAGVYSHFQAELVAGHAMETPYVKPAVEGLRRELEKVRLTEENDPARHTKSASAPAKASALPH